MRWMAAKKSSLAAAAAAVALVALADLRVVLLQS